jgi:osmotically-inducible protein OsmY/prolyl-tRNA editing enzyme YbaK/EbsC (Cys-tRNA(Pro) deacylase)
MRTDKAIRLRIIDELAWEASIDTAHITIAVDSGIVTLSGHVPSFAEKWSTEHVAKRISGVRAVNNQIVVRLPGASERNDRDLAQAALHTLEWDVLIPHRQVTVTVNDGWITLVGEVDTLQQKQSAERILRTLTGVRGVTNLIKVMPKVLPTDVTTNIISAFQRNALLDARKIQVETDGGRVVLRGAVHSWAERETAERAAGVAPGVTEVENQLTVLSATCREKLEAYLRTNHVYVETQHHRAAYTAQGVAASEHLPGHSLAKVVMAVADGALTMLVLPADHRADLIKARTQLAAYDLRLADEPDFIDRFPDCEPGAMPPFGNLYNLPVYVDKRLTHEPTIVFQAGTHRDTMRITYADFARLVNPAVVDISLTPELTAPHF